MGGNGAIESAAELVNALVERKNKGRLDGLTSKEVQAIGKQVQDVRHKRARFIIALSHKMQAIFACENNLLSRILWHVVGPMVGEELPPRSIPYDHELPAKPWRSKITRLTAPCFTAAMGGVVFYLSRGNRVSPISEFYNCTEPFLSWLQNLLHQVEFSQITRAIGPAQYTGMTLPMGYFLSQLISPILIFTIEGHRTGNRLSPLALPSLFNGALQTLGLGRVTAIHAIFSGLSGFGTPPGRRIRPEVAKSLIPALSLGYVLPMSLLLMYPGNLTPWKRLVWYLSPVCVSTLSRVLPALQSPWRKKKAAKSPGTPNGPKDPLFGRYSLTDVSPLKLSYDFASALQAAAHVAALVHGYRPARLALYELYDTAILFSGTFDMRAFVLSMIPGLLLHDAIFGVIPVMMSNLYTVWDLRRRGNITTWQATRATLGVVVGQFLVGPGATWALLWRWRESKIVSLSIT
ncbi:unnamed protein product [Parascedosporium putredinis]|uniref:Uncharacterized protein n=1 Tax=Parascedosporium putredinis TaxID=1442378 RepID=A0A9P1HA76_9PEZI|nr:unnamed protein product [Parascedosporium putredinis]CAI8002527.1 unnamed protein product [Parascedosporium putredinis]